MTKEKDVILTHVSEVTLQISLTTWPPGHLTTTKSVICCRIYPQTKINLSTISTIRIIGLCRNTFPIFYAEIPQTKWSKLLEGILFVQKNLSQWSPGSQVMWYSASFGLGWDLWKSNYPMIFGENKKHAPSEVPWCS